MTLSPLAKKLYLKPHQRLLALNAPDDFRAALEPLPEGTTLDSSPADGVVYDSVYFFAKNAADATDLATIAIAALKFDGLLWGAWQKENAKRKRDLTRDTGWEYLYQQQLTTVASISISDTWSALRWRSVERVGK
jgi:hypothetical protein